MKRSRAPARSSPSTARATMPASRWQAEPVVIWATGTPERPSRRASLSVARSPTTAAHRVAAPNSDEGPLEERRLARAGRGDEVERDRSRARGSGGGCARPGGRCPPEATGAARPCAWPLAPEGVGGACSGGLMTSRSGQARARGPAPARPISWPHLGQVKMKSDSTSNSRSQSGQRPRAGTDSISRSAPAAGVPFTAASKASRSASGSTPESAPTRSTMW